jgi:hypothetical protein
MDFTGSTLEVLRGYAPAGADTWTIVNNTGVGTYTGLLGGNAEGASVSIGGAYVATLTYVGGTGNDIVLSNPVELASISGEKFGDVDGDGVKDGGEVGLDGWSIELVNPVGGAVLDTQVTAGGGLYTFAGLTPGTYIVREVQQAGWAQTLPTPSTYTETLLAAQNLAGRDFGNAEGGAVLVSGSAVAFTDADGDLVTVRLSGGGSGVFYFNTPGNSDISDMYLNNTTVNSTLSMRVAQLAGAGETSIDNATIVGDMRNFIAPKTDLTSDINISGGLVGSMRLDDVRADHVIDIGVSANPAATASFIFDLVEDLVLTSLTPIRSIRATEWLDVAGANDIITAPWIGSLTTTGRAAVPGPASAGDFQADLTLTGQDARGWSVARANIAGEVTGTWDLTAGGAGGIGSLRAGSTAAGWTVNAPARYFRNLNVVGNLAGTLSVDYFGRIFTGGNLTAGFTVAGAHPTQGYSINSLTAGSVQDVALTLTGGINSIRVTEWVDTGGGTETIQATWIRRLTTTGNFQPDLTFTGQDPAGWSLANANVRGTLTGTWDLTAGGAGGVSSLRAGSTAAGWTVNAPARVFRNLNVTGNLAGTVSVNYFGRINTRGNLTAAFTVAGADPVRGLSINSLTAGSVQEISLTLPGGVNVIRVVEWVDAGGDDTLQAAWIRRLNTTGNFQVGLTFTGKDAGGWSLRNANVGGALTGTWDLSAGGAGNVRSLRAGSTAAGWTVNAPGRYFRTMYTTGVLGGTVLVDYFGRIYARGNMTAALTAGGADPRTGDSIRSLYVAGRMVGARVQTTDGIRRVIVGGMQNSDILAGVPTAFAGRFATVPGDFTGGVGTTAVIRGVNIRGIRGVAGFFMDDSNFTATGFGPVRGPAVKLLNADPGNPSTLNVLNLESNVRRVRYRDTADPANNWNWRPGQAWPAGAELVLTVIT